MLLHYEGSKFSAFLYRELSQYHRRRSAVWLVTEGCIRSDV